MKRRHAIPTVIAFVVAFASVPALAQNDWQFPDPYFGILEIEKSHTPAADRRYRAEIAPQPNRQRPPSPRTRQRFFRPRPRPATPAAAG
jgi:hypothetical protein